MHVDVFLKLASREFVASPKHCWYSGSDWTRSLLHVVDFFFQGIDFLFFVRIPEQWQNILALGEEAPRRLVI